MNNINADPEHGSAITNELQKTSTINKLTFYSLSVPYLVTHKITYRKQVSWLMI